LRFALLQDAATTLFWIGNGRQADPPPRPRPSRVASRGNRGRVRQLLWPESHAGREDSQASMQTVL